MSDARVLATAEVARDRRSLRRGLLGRDGIDGAIVLERCRWVHTIGMRFELDVAHLDADGRVLRVATMRRHRVGRPVIASCCVIEAQRGAFERWGLHVGDVVEVRASDDDPGVAPAVKPDDAATGDRSRSPGTDGSG